eukprot:SAG11_NODE_32085_length_286_cov_1.112299_1_plen_75_part_01
MLCAGVFAALDGGSTSSAALRGLFDRLDRDGGGGLGIDELQELSQSLRLSLTLKELQQALVEMDKDKDGEVNFCE